MNILELLKPVKDDAENDMANMEGQPFTGKNVATQFGNNAAAIVALCAVCDLLYKKIKMLENDKRTTN